MKYSGLIFTAVLFWIQLSTINGDESAENEVALNAAVQGINTFSTSLYKVLSENPGNLVVSPFSVEGVLAMLSLGLRGDTASQVAAALHLPADRLQMAQGFKALLHALQNTENVTLEIANKIYVQQGFGIKDEYRQSTEQYFNSVAEEVNITGDTENVRLAINALAAEKTHNKIQDLLREGSLTRDTIMVLLNAVYFKGLWEKSFIKNWTSNERFHLNSTSSKNVAMMHLSAHLFHDDAYGLNLQVLKLPYQGGKHSMLIFLPKSVDGLQQLESNIANITNIITSRSFSFSWYGRQMVLVSLPRFKIFSSIDLNSPLQNLGMGLLFSGGNFSGITDGEASVTRVLQKAFIEVNEEGTDAGAEPVSDPPKGIRPPPILFTADHPFIYTIVEEETGTILLMGRVVEPEE